ncbi:GldG family protein [Erythrobacter crassostreae]|uniref:DUF4350 domain-containing protein n=1 Tax=Erythrobacter crassostreae TaxID=2828328 RepID=A0A9X1JN23_9SPHN|nr:GldG family protein [Erythrobacter crassostrea]MBV7259313.1 hypothetical protein [Erythrobacter crassostrea]
MLPGRLMIRLLNRIALAGFTIAAASSCTSEPKVSAPEPACFSGETPPDLALMTSLPIYWPANFFFDGLDGEIAEPPWQRLIIEECHTLIPLDTLSKDSAGTDPLLGHERLAVIQPRGLSPADNVALDEWVRGGGQLLLVLDPMLVGEYDSPLGDPARPVEAALIPPVVARWGLQVSFDENQSPDLQTEIIGEGLVPLMQTGTISRVDPSDETCGVIANGAAASCQIGEGRVTLLADATVFEADVEARENGYHPLLNLLKYSF